MNKLDVKACGLAAGIVWGGSMLFIGLTATFFNWGIGFENVMKTFYVGYNNTFTGSLIGGAWGFVDGGVGGIMFAWVYNKFAK